MNINIAAGWTARAVVMLMSFVNMRLMIDRIGTEGLAAYSIIISLTTWLTLMNLGLPIAIQNAISQLRGQQFDHRSTRDHAYGSMFIVTLVMAPLAIIVAILAHHFLLMGYPFASNVAVVCACLLIYIGGKFE